MEPRDPALHHVPSANSGDRVVLSARMADYRLRVAFRQNEPAYALPLMERFIKFAWWNSRCDVDMDTGGESLCAASEMIKRFPRPK